METASRRANRLAQENSPYLLQHAYNPVDWYPWGEEAFRAAKEQEKPILLSIGYSSCHWCHVMERESFESESIAEVMNRHYISVKVDREERPDVDAIYMNFVQMATGSGGWPLTVFLTPDQIPFFGGTYFPPDDRYGRPGFRRLLESLAGAYRDRKEEVQRSTEETIARLRLAAGWPAAPGELNVSLLETAASQTMRHWDPSHGGFGSAPKFPSAMSLGFLLRYQRRSGDEEALQVIHSSLQGMARGGIYDQVGGGFHRYAVDERWLVPHFEKMLYDNALLARLYIEAFQHGGQDEYRRVACEVLEWTLREMTDPSGGFYSALDADSEGEEGKFYVWTPQQTKDLLGDERGSLFNDFYDISASGNFEGSNIPHHRYELEGFAKSKGLEVDELRAEFDRCRSELLQERAKRVPPGLDDKVLAAWNGMMLSALAEAAWALDHDGFLQAARRNARFLADSMVVEGRLKRTWKQGSAKYNAYLEDYACVAEGLLALWQVSGESEWLDLAEQLTLQQIDLFWDESEGDFFFTSNDHEELIVRQKEFMDNATPSGNSASCLNLLKLAILKDNSGFRAKAERLLGKAAKSMGEHALAFGYWLQALDFHLGPVAEVALVGEPSIRGKLEGPLRRLYYPNKVVALARPGDEALSARVPLLRGKGAEGKALGYVCRNFACRQPADTPEELERILLEMA